MQKPNREGYCMSMNIRRLQKTAIQGYRISRSTKLKAAEFADSFTTH